ncbi:YncE family protein [Parachitinimonas caeni]|uniref:YncE family protein n=1 Tax=Parachitinimonas caeni TaxID=3031301 RepID=UPI0024DEC91B|nr:hypothetical protein [Parachitinimonas caeni]
MSPAKGRLDAQGSELTFTVDPGILGFGMNETPVMLTANMGGETVSSPIVVVTRVDKHLLLPSAWAIGLSSTPHFARLSQRLKVLDSFGVAASWQARSDAGWLRVTPSGSTGSGSELVVEANPDTLPSGQISYANVTILPDDARINPVQVKVALWKGGDAPETSRWMIPYSRIVADPLRPVVYVHNGGQAIDVYNAYTTHKVATIIEPGMIAGAMAVSPDGGTLYVYDGAASQVVTFDLQTQQKISSWPMRKLNDGPESLLVTRLNGVDLLLNSYGGVTRGEVFVGAPGLRGFVVASANGQRIFARRSSGEMVSVKLDYTHLFGGVLEVTGPPSEPFTAAAGSDIAVAADDSSIYTAGSGTGYCARLDPASLMPTDHFSVQQGVANNVEVTTDGRVVCGIRSIDLTADLWVHSATGAVIKHRRLAGAGTALRGRSLVLTPDGNVAVALTDDSAINFTGIGH